MVGLAMQGPAPEVTPPVPWLFFLVAIAVAVFVGGMIAYLGVTGHLGAGIPGSKSPSGGIVLAIIGGLVDRRVVRSRWRDAA